MVALDTTTATDTTTAAAEMSVFTAPETPRIVMIDAPYVDLSIPIGVTVERIVIPIVSDPASRAEAEKILPQLEALKPYVEADEDAHFDLRAIIADLNDDIGWYDAEPV